MSAEKPIYPGRPRQFEDEDVIDAAVAVFSVNGYAGTSAQDLCNGTGLGRGSLYNAFGSKQALYEQALLRSHEHTMSAQLAILTQPGPVKERLRTLLLWGIDEDLLQPEQHDAMVLFSALERGSKDHAVASLNQEYRQRLEQTLVAVFTEGQQNGELVTKASAIEMARGFLAGYYGLRVLNKNISDRNTLEDVVAGLLINL
ncbi:TetR/AcrR family transcriptional regulator [Serratia quinivorans]|uniref:TetR/AcrR family transcriptional regulator n=1 Tax=Serratia quinivorans TaxID=137545 RepID=UPI00217CBFB8|nr:TetR/AcrR family transcriptional regulator [Serratia quinivorans]CAI0830162.1 Intercellular adhesion protein R [Serratia quinivorans]CAI0832983.1 Intercellular adhesion protein R [Serratia quinivorans]CAI0855911.1 Intercellular adhesion protein R [Serratia quinivorans]CAI1498651.1 Intercellular adhesion protein R [Serratia quinivorans]CAI2040208.1 Intercellular adhesion protein R [Serratia quinivorans]